MTKPRACVGATHRDVRLPGGRRLRVSFLGSGADHIISLHGLGSSYAALGYLNSRLVEEQGKHVLSITLPNHGYSSDASSFRDMGEMISDGVHLLGHEQALIFGHSLGGLVGTYVARYHPELVRTTVAANSPLGSKYDGISLAEIILRLEIVGLDTAVSAARLMAQSLLWGNIVEDADLIAKSFYPLPRIAQAPRVLADAAKALEGAVVAVGGCGIEQVRLWGRRDFGVPPSHGDPGRDVMIPGGHCSVVFEAGVSAICREIGLASAARSAA